MRCGACGAGALKGARFCSRCGASMTGAASDRPVVPDADIHAARRSDLGGSMAKGAAIGAVIGIPLPFIGPVAGAVVGAGIAAYRKLKD